MPYSYNGLDHWFMRDVRELVKPSVVYDVGVGAGKVGGLLKQVQPQPRVHGFEVHPFPNIPEGAYADIKECDFAEWLKDNVDWSADLIVFGDVLEHFDYGAAMSTLDMVNYRAKWIAIFTPLHYLQNTIEGNSHEAHRCRVLPNDLMRFDLVHYVKDVKEDIYYALLKGLR